MEKKMARWATVNEAAEYMRVKPQTVYNWINKEKGIGKLFYQADGCTRRVDLDDVDKLMKGAK
jgi:excisionase family DNA binding protein